MKTTSNLSNKYISEVKKKLKCSAKKRTEFLDTLTPEIYNFELEHPNATYNDYINEFDTPKSTAEEYMKELSDKEKNAYWIPRIGTIVAVVIMAFAFLMVLFISQIDASSGYTDLSQVKEVSGSEFIYAFENDVSTKNSL